MKLSMPAKIYSENRYTTITIVDFFMGKNYCHRKYLDEVFEQPIMPRGRDKKFSSIGNNLTADIYDGKTYITKLRDIKRIAVHCTATPIGRELGAKDIDNMHLNRWGPKSGCGYHYIIKIDGTIEKGRWVDSPGAHVRGYNASSIGIAYIGGVDSNLDPAEDRLTPQQSESLVTLIELLLNEYNLDKSKVLGHREFPNVYKACPCLDMDAVRKRV